MLTKRIIPCLDVEDGQVVKGVQFKNLRRAGDPASLARAYYAQGADELTFLDIGASPHSRDLLVELVEEVAQEIFIPLTVGGGLRSLEDMRKALKAGADKVALCTAALKNPHLLSEGARAFGSQCMVLSIDAKRVGQEYYATSHGGRRITSRKVLQWAQEGEALGAGEILLNSVDQDGTREGYDLELTRMVATGVQIPVIASGGAGTREQIAQAFKEGQADAALLASLLHDEELTVGQLKEFLKEQGVAVRC